MFGRETLNLRGSISRGNPARSAPEHAAKGIPQLGNPGKIKVSVVMPSFNEERAVSEMIKEIRKNTAQFETEILLVDSSSDKTAEIAQGMGVRVISQRPQGHGIALRTAIREAKNDFIITSDCDNTYPMEFIPALVGKAVSENYDLISCCRMHSGLGKEMPGLNKFGNWFFAFLVRKLYGIKTHDVTTGMFCIRRTLNDRIKWETNYSLPCEIIVRSRLEGGKCCEVEIPYKTRIGEVTLNRWRSGKAYLRCIFNYKFDLGLDPKLM